MKMQRSVTDPGLSHQETNGVAITQVPHDIHTPAHDWEDEKRRGKQFFDDGTMTFFWRAHRLTILVIFAVVLFYVAIFDPQLSSTESNTKRGIIAVVLAFVLFGVTITPDGPFRRPHPALWRLCLCLSIVYELSLIFILFQNVNDARKLLKHIDPKLGEALPEKDYGGDCKIYDDTRPDDPWHHFIDKLDVFVLVHFFGWWLKTLILRDWWLCMVISIMFEVLEYTLEHQLANFRECWWDHWVMDALICNSGGIYLGMKTLDFLNAKPYFWRGMWNIPTYRGKMTRILKQFTPYSWMGFDWRPVSSLKRWIAMLALIAAFLAAEVNIFYLKWVLWIPNGHYILLGRLICFMFWGATAMRETFQFLDDKNCKQFGTQSWIVASIIITEILIACKFDWDTISKPIPYHMNIFWALTILSLVLWTLWHFYFQRLLWHTENKLNNGRRARTGEDNEEEEDSGVEEGSVFNNNNTKNDTHDREAARYRKHVTIKGRKQAS